MRRGAPLVGSVMGIRMRFPSYPSNREADERAEKPLSFGREGAQVE